MAKFKPGDKVWAISDVRCDLVPDGKYAGVVVGEHTPNMIDFFILGAAWYQVSIEGLSSGPNHDWGILEECLEPRHDPYEGDQAGDWDTAPWQPEKVTV
jgi:hypothetical protein